MLLSPYPTTGASDFLRTISHSVSPVTARLYVFSLYTLRFVFPMKRIHIWDGRQIGLAAGPVPQSSTSEFWFSRELPPSRTPSMYVFETKRCKHCFSGTVLRLMFKIDL